MIGEHSLPSWHAWDSQAQQRGYSKLTPIQFEFLQEDVDLCCDQREKKINWGYATWKKGTHSHTHTQTHTLCEIKRALPVSRMWKHSCEHRRMVCAPQVLSTFQFWSHSVSNYRKRNSREFLDKLWEAKSGNLSKNDPLHQNNSFRFLTWSETVGTLPATILSR